jgi:hypothetical protein
VSDRVVIYCHGHKTYAYPLFVNWYCARCGQRVKVVT